MGRENQTSVQGSKKPRVLVVGAGFAGLSLVRRLRRAPCEIVLVDRRNHHLFQPLLYQVATAALSPADIAAPIRSVLSRQGNVQVVLGEATSVDLDGRQVRVGDDEIGYDWLVLAAGATHDYFGNNTWGETAPGLKTVDDALEIRRRILLAFERAELEEDAEARMANLTFVIVGGGPTGVEMAGALREIAANSIPRDFRRVDTTSARVVIVEGQDRLLPTMSDEAGRQAKLDLEAMGVEVRLGTFVTNIEPEAVYAGDERIPSSNVIWAAGVRGESIAETLGVELDRVGRVRVEPDCSVPGYPDAFVVGDLAYLEDPVTGRLVPGVAQGALQQGAFVADLIREAMQGRGSPDGPRVFRYRDKGDMATIGRALAVADVGGRTLSGFPAWLLWSVVHILFLIGFRNKLLVMINWIWQWVIHGRGARLITGSPEIKLRKQVDL
jgi:NADH dehydrogenase